MTPPDSALPETVLLNVPSVVQARLHGRDLMLGRLIWTILVLFAFGVYLLSVPVHIRELRTVSADPSRAYYFLTPAEETALLTLGLSVDIYITVIEIAALGMLLAFVGTGVLIFSRRSDNVLTILLSLTLIVLGITYNDSISSLARLSSEWAVVVFVVQNIGFGATFISLLLLPDGTFYPRWTRYLIIVLGVWFVIGLFFRALNPLSTDSNWGKLALFGMLVVGTGVQVYRYFNHSNMAERRQMRWITLGVVVAVLGFGLWVIPQFIFPALASGAPRVLFNLIGIPLLIILPGCMAPATLYISIARHRLWGIDMLLNRVLLYATVTAILSIVYFGLVTLVQQIFQAATGLPRSDLAIIISTLLVAALFQPVRQRLQAWVARRFQVTPARTVSTIAVRSTDEMPAIPASAIGRFSGHRMGSYEVLDSIGHGGMAEVYKARHVALNKIVALKVLSVRLENSADFRRRFEREAQTVAGLHHPNIVQVFDFGEADETYYMTMDYIDGADLTRYLKTHGPLSYEQARPIIRDIAQALDFAHAKGIVHRDVKPSNIMLRLAANGQSPHALLTDFGLARLFTEGNADTHSGVIGTLNYIAPEQIAAVKNVGPSADIYALGVVTYEMLTGQVVFEADNPGALLLAHLQRPAPDPRKLIPNLPAHAALAVMQALSKVPDERYPTAGDFLAAFELGAALAR